MLAPASGCENESARSKPGVLAGPCLGLTCPEEGLLCDHNGILNLARSLAPRSRFASPVTLPSDSSTTLCDRPRALIRSMPILISFWPVHHNSQTSQRFHREAYAIYDCCKMRQSRHNKSAPFCVLMAQNLFSRVGSSNSTFTFNQNFHSRNFCFHVVGCKALRIHARLWRRGLRAGSSA
jgi:hypothetical protein